MNKKNNILNKKAMELVKWCENCKEKRKQNFLEMTLAAAMQDKNIFAIKQLLTLPCIDLGWSIKCPSHDGGIMRSLMYSTNIEMIDMFLAHPSFPCDPYKYHPMNMFSLSYGGTPFNETESQAIERHALKFKGFLHYAFHPRVFYSSDERIGNAVSSNRKENIEEVEWLLAIGRCFYKKEYTFRNDSGSGKSWWRELTLTLSEHFNISAYWNRHYPNDGTYLSSLLQLSLDFHHFEINPKHVIQKYRTKVGLEWDLASEVFMICSLIAKGYFTLKKEASKETHRFTKIFSMLCPEIQMLLCQRSCGSMRDFIKTECLEKACKLTFGICVFLFTFCFQSHFFQKVCNAPLMGFLQSVHIP